MPREGGTLVGAVIEAWVTATRRQLQEAPIE